MSDINNGITNDTQGIIIYSDEIKTLIPHRYPMLLVDRVYDLKLGESCIGLKNVSANEEFFVGHFPEKATMPGVLMIEAMAQTACVLACKSLGDAASNTSHVYFASIEKARFRAPVIPGDTLHIHVCKLKERLNIWFFSGKAYVDGKIVCDCEFSAVIPK